MKQQRPINLDLATLKFPAMAIASILHRISGVLLFILFPIMLYLLQCSLKSTASFDETKALMAQPFLKVLTLGFLSAFAYHLFAGIRHLIMDMGYGETVKSSRFTAILVIGLGLLSMFGLGIWIW